MFNYIMENYLFAQDVSSNVILDFLCAISLSVLFYREKCSKKTWWTYVLFFLFNWLVGIIAKSIAGMILKNGYYSIYISGLIIAFLCGLPHVKKLGWTNYVLSACVFMSVYVYSAAIVFPLLWQEKNWWSWNTFSVLSVFLDFLFYCGVGLLLRKFALSKDSRGKRNFVLLIVLITCLGYILSLFSNIYFDFDPYKVGYTFICNVCLLILEVLAYILFFELINNYDEKFTLLKEQTRIKNDVAMLSIYKKNYEDIRAVRHDSKNQFGIIVGLLEQKEYEKLEKFVREIVRDLNPIGYTVYCNNSVVNILLNKAEESAVSLGIATDFRAAVPESISLTDTLLASVLGNLLNNALEAAANVKGKRTIAVTVQLEEKNLLIHIENPYIGTVRTDSEGFPLTSKPDKENHGVGLKIVKKQVEQNDGYFEYTAAQGIFSVDVFMKCSEVLADAENKT